MGEAEGSIEAVIGKASAGNGGTRFIRWRANLNPFTRWLLDLTVLAVCLLIIWLELADILSSIGLR